MLGFVGVLTHPDPKAVLVIGHGAGGTPYGAGANPATDRVRVVEIVAPVYDVMAAYKDLGGKTAVDRLWNDRRYERSIGDARHVLFTEDERYDVIEADAIYPRTSHSGLLYSIEYFARVRSRLQAGGLCVQWAPTARTLNSFLDVFPHVVELDVAYDKILLGSDRPIPFDLEALIGRLHEPAIRAYLQTANWKADAIGHMLREARERLWGPEAPRPSGDVNTDLFPKDEFYLNHHKIALWSTWAERR
jgi:spermidine synthase